MKKILFIIVIIILVVLGMWVMTQKEEEISPIVVNEPQSNETVSSPLSVSGEAIGPWFFEGDFPIVIESDTGETLGESFVTADGEWMTEEYVSFGGTISFDPMTFEAGELVFIKNNPSGLPEHDAEYRVPVRFANAPADEEMREVALYYYDPTVDTDEGGNIMCSEEGIVPVSEQIPVTMTPIQDTIRRLISTEAPEGVTSEFPLPGFSLDGASFVDGVLTLSFSDPQNQTSGGSCRATILRLQIERTALAFPEVDEVIIEPETLFQP